MSNNINQGPNLGLSQGKKQKVNIFGTAGALYDNKDSMKANQANLNNLQMIKAPNQNFERMNYPEQFNQSQPLENITGHNGCASVDIS